MVNFSDFQIRAMAVISSWKKGEQTLSDSDKEILGEIMSGELCEFDLIDSKYADDWYFMQVAAGVSL